MTQNDRPSDLVPYRRTLADMAALFTVWNKTTAELAKQPMKLTEKDK
jgi:hypothetical protein